MTSAFHSLPSGPCPWPARRSACGFSRFVLAACTALAIAPARGADEKSGTAPASDAAWLMSEVAGATARPAVSAESAPPGLQLCLAPAADLSPIFPTTEFRSNDRMISVLFRLEEGMHPKRLMAEFIPTEVPNVPSGKAVAHATLGPPEAFGSFALMIGTQLPPGKYRVDVSADGTLWKSADFTVVPTLPAPEVKKPEALVALTPGRTWTYELTQEVAAGAKITDVPQGITQGPDGKYHGVVVATITGVDAAGAHFQYQRRGGAGFMDEWWRLDFHGLTATQRRMEGGELITLDSPQVLWRLPLKSSGEWTYKFKQTNVHQNIRQWGPVPLRGPEGTRAGFVVVVNQEVGPTAITVEREFIPGAGMVRQVYTTGLRGRFVQRETMLLTDVK